MKTLKGDVDSLNRYGIADAARTRITAQILRNVIKPPQRQLLQPFEVKVTKEKDQP
ncbi:hypothetical protein [Noviherbaspirillum malthae]|uniref:hypothetical protein n=1 Tax=Noviherbaspirillum malthae TaxID=1260987 RepID=UPI00188F1BD3|nr:hypothetical protein [Noviherbaspirillum malthae]